MLAQNIDKKFNAKHFRTSNLKLDYPGVKVMTMHAAQGLEFPVVVLAGFSDGSIPNRQADDVEKIVQQRRLFFVACSRSMRHLLVLGDRVNPSVFQRDFREDCWDMNEEILAAS